MTQKRLHEKVAIITGGGSGIGKTIARAFAREGARVVVADLSLRKARQTVHSIGGKGGSALAIKTDVRSRADAERLVRKTLEVWGRVDILVNNAGVELLKDFVETDEADWDRVVMTNLKGPFLVTQCVLPTMTRQQRGKIVNIASVTGVVGFIYSALYAATKAGLMGMTRAIAAEYATDGIRCNAICPGYVYTPMTQDMLDNEIIRERVIAQIPLGRLSYPERDIAPLAVYLASKESDFMTGQSHVIDGGFSIR